MEDLRVTRIAHIIDLFTTPRWTRACGVLHLAGLAKATGCKLDSPVQRNEEQRKHFFLSICTIAQTENFFPLLTPFVLGKMSLNCEIPSDSRNFLKDTCFIHQPLFCCYTACALGRKCALLL